MAALLAAVGVGVYDSVESACEKCIRVTDQTEVGPDKEVYADFYLATRPCIRLSRKNSLPWPPCLTNMQAER